jgi:hypothetical protein
MNTEGMMMNLYTRLHVRRIVARWQRHQVHSKPRGLSYNLGTCNGDRRPVLEIMFNTFALYHGKN